MAFLLLVVPVRVELTLQAYETRVRTTRRHHYFKVVFVRPVLGGLCFQLESPKSRTS